MVNLYTVIIKSTNGSEDRVEFKNFIQVQDYYRNRISYSGGRVKRVEVDMSKIGGGLRAIWDISWDEVSKAASLMR